METPVQENAVLSQNQPILPEQPKQNNFLVILLSVLLLLSISIAGFFAYQTQMLVNELTLLKSSPSPVSSAEPTMKPAGTFDNVDSWTTVKTEDGFSFKYPPIEAKSSIDFQFNNAYKSPDCLSKTKSETRFTNGQKLALDYYVYLNTGICSSDNLDRLVVNVQGYPPFVVLYEDSEKDLAMSFLDTIVSTFKSNNK
jgi:hypothetical protein